MLTKWFEFIYLRFDMAASHKISPSKWYFLTVTMSDKHTVLTVDEERLGLNHTSLLNQPSGSIHLGKF